MAKGRSKSNYLQDLVAATNSQYPFVGRYKPVVTQGPDTGDYAETWPIGEPGDKSYPRPQNIPIDRTGVQVMRPGQFHPADLAGEMLHVDPFAQGTRNILQQILGVDQIRNLQHASGDYGQSLKMGLAPEKAMSNAVDSAVRGSVVGQWPAEANASMHYTPEQSNLLENLRQYMTQGYYPSNFKLKPGK